MPLPSSPVRVLLVAAIMGLGLVWWFVTGGPGGPPPVPTTADVPLPLSSPSSFVGKATCATCHPDIAAAHDTSGHAHTFSASADFEIAASLDGSTFDDSLRDGKFEYHFDKEGLSVTLQEQFGDDRFPLHYALGSGKHGVTFLSLIPHEEGHTLGVEHRATFFGSTGKLGLTPGQRSLPEPSQPIEHFGRIFQGRDLDQCVECHTTSGYIEHEQILGLIPHVGCESCHGPGSEHVRLMEADLPDPDMSVAGRWPEAIDQVRLCGKCHRLPGMLKETELRRDSVGLVRLQSVGLLQSECFTKSDDLRCSTCHDPHAAPSQNHQEYVAVCLNCHNGAESALCPQSAATGCLGCHMPGIEINQSVFHDHWIRVRTEDDPKPAEPHP